MISKTVDLFVLSVVASALFVALVIAPVGAAIVFGMVR